MFLLFPPLFYPEHYLFSLFLLSILSVNAYCLPSPLSPPLLSPPLLLPCALFSYSPSFRSCLRCSSFLPFPASTFIRPLFSRAGRPRRASAADLGARDAGGRRVRGRGAMVDARGFLHTGTGGCLTRPGTCTSRGDEGRHDHREPRPYARRIGGVCCVHPVPPTRRGRDPGRGLGPHLEAAVSSGPARSGPARRCGRTCAPPCAVRRRRT